MLVLDRLLAAAVVSLALLFVWSGTAACEEDGGDYAAVLRDRWNSSDRLELSMQVIRQYNGKEFATMALVDYSRDGHKRIVVRRELELPSNFKRWDERVLNDDHTWQVHLEEVKRARPLINTFDGIRHRTYRPLKDGTYECIVRAEPFFAYLIPRMWKGHLLFGQEPLGGVVAEAAEAKLDGHRALVVGWRTSAFLMAFSASSGRHEKYVRIRRLKSKLLDSLADGETYEDLLNSKDCDTVSTVFSRDPETGLPARVMSWYEIVGLTEWYRLLAARRIEVLVVPETPEELTEETITVLDEVTRRVHLVRDGVKTDVTPSADLRDVVAVKDNDARDAYVRWICGAIGILLIIGAAVLRRRGAPVSR